MQIYSSSIEVQSLQVIIDLPDVLDRLCLIFFALLDCIHAVFDSILHIRRHNRIYVLLCDLTRLRHLLLFDLTLESHLLVKFVSQVCAFQHIALKLSCASVAITSLRSALASTVNAVITHSMTVVRIILDLTSLQVYLTLKLVQFA